MFIRIEKFALDLASAGVERNGSDGIALRSIAYRSPINAQISRPSLIALGVVFFLDCGETFIERDEPVMRIAVFSPNFMPILELADFLVKTAAADGRPTVCTIEDIFRDIPIRVVFILPIRLEQVGLR
jgi:hypothetical protein